MAVKTITIREHSTASIVMQLLANSAAIDLTSVTSVELDMVDNLGKVYRYLSTDSPAYIVITTPGTGTVTFTPPDATLFRYELSPYRLYCKVTDANSKTYTVPESTYGEINAIKEY